MQQHLEITAEVAEMAKPIKLKLGKDGKPASWTTTIKALVNFWNKKHD